MGPNKLVVPTLSKRLQNASLVSHRIFPLLYQGYCRSGPAHEGEPLNQAPISIDRVPICHRHPLLTVCNRNLVGLDIELYTYPEYVECGSSWPQKDSEVRLCARRSYT